MNRATSAPIADRFQEDLTPQYAVGQLLQLNELICRINIPYEVNEAQIESWVNMLEKTGEVSCPLYWLICIRLNEVALLCAGNYADNCEFAAAGDLLVNPREILIHSKEKRDPVRKWRHGRLSDQFRKNGQSRSNTIASLKNKYQLDITLPPLLPYLFRSMKESNRVSETYLTHADRRMHQITNTIAFLTSWQISEATDLHRRTRQATPETRSFIASHLCRFDNRIFTQTGYVIQQLATTRSARHLSVDGRDFSDY